MTELPRTSAPHPVIPHARSSRAIRHATRGLLAILVAAGCSTSDAGNASAPSDDAGDAGPPPCGSSAWTTYGHDARRTFASDGCVPGALTQVFHYKPEPPMGRMFSGVFHAVARADAFFVVWAATNPPYLGTTAADRVDTTGKRVWTWDSGTDANVGNWPSIASSFLAVNDDGLFLLDLEKGTKLHDTGVDWWGQTIPDPSRLYVVNTMKADGPGLFVGAVDSTAKVLWQANMHDGCGNGFGDVRGGIAENGGVLFYAPLYRKGVGDDPGFASGVFAFDGKDGKPRWNQTTKPKSAISASDDRVFLVEEPATLVARAQSDGAIAWSKPLSPALPGAQAPVVANDLVIVATSNGVQAFRRDKGDLAWTASINAPAQPLESVINNGCGGSVAMGGALQTTMAAALASGTLIVTAFDAIHVLSLATGAELSKTKADGGFSAARDPVIVGKRLYVIEGDGVTAYE